MTERMTKPPTANTPNSREGGCSLIGVARSYHTSLTQRACSSSLPRHLDCAC